MHTSIQIVKKLFMMQLLNFEIDFLISYGLAAFEIILYPIPRDHTMSFYLAGARSLLKSK